MYIPLFFNQIAFVSNWFIGKDLSFAMGVMCSISFSAILLETYITPNVYDVMKKNENTHEFGLVAVIGLGFCIFSLLVSVFLIHINFYAEK